MLIDIVKKGSTDRSVLLRVIDSTDGTPETTVAYNTAGVDLWYRREGATKTSITEATLATADAAHSDGGFIHVGDGYCRLDLPDAAFATGANYVDVGGTFTGMIVIGGRVRLVGIDLEDGVRGGMTALPNAAAEAAGGLYTRGTGAGQINQPANGQIDANTAAMSSGVLTATAIAADAITAAKVADDVSTEFRTKAMALTTCSGVVGSASTTANVVASSVAVGATTSISADAWKGRVIIFNSDTSTAALRGQAGVIQSHTSGTTPTFTMLTAAWTTAPLSGDTFTVV